MPDKDISKFCATFPLSGDLEGKTILITGATGLIGSTMLRCLCAAIKDINIIAPVRNISKAKRMFSSFAGSLTLVESDLATLSFRNLPTIDYVIHCAAPTSSRFFVEHPVETYRSIHDITAHLLDETRRNNVQRFVYLSSLEVYGTILDDTKEVTEDVQGYINPLSIRSSYPIAKRATECLCHLYAMQYDMNITIARLTQTTGAGISADDNRIIAQFARLAANGEDIILHTTGESSRPYCYTTDAVSAILYILLKGEKGEAYNVANAETYISARDMAYYLQQNFAPTINVRIEVSETNCYAPPTKLRLSTRKLQSLGWQPQYDLNEIFTNLIADISSTSSHE